jgi:hypothetical protein
LPWLGPFSRILERSLALNGVSIQSKRLALSETFTALAVKDFDARHFGWAV